MKAKQPPHALGLLDLGRWAHGPPPPAGPPPGLTPKSPEEAADVAPLNEVFQAADEAHFVGFCHSESAYAWRLHYSRSYQGQNEQISLIALYRSRDGVRVATFKDTASSPHAATWAAYAESKSHALWQRIAHKGHFKTLQHGFLDSMVRLLPDADSRFTAQPENKRAQLTGYMGMPLGYTAMARLFEGDQIPLMHFRHEGAVGKRWRAELEVHHSHTGHKVAVLERLYLDGTHKPFLQSSVVSTGDDPLGSTVLHPMKTIDLQARSARKMFHAMHPKGRAEYDTYVGIDF